MHLVCLYEVIYISTVEHLQDVFKFCFLFKNASSNKCKIAL